MLASKWSGMNAAQKHNDFLKKPSGMGVWIGEKCKPNKDKTVSGLIYPWFFYPTEMDKANIALNIAREMGEGRLLITEDDKPFTPQDPKVLAIHNKLISKMQVGAG